LFYECSLQVRVFDGPTTRRGMVRAHGGAIADVAFTAVRGQVLLAATSIDGRISMSHVVPPDGAASSPAAAAAAASDLSVNTVVALELGGAYGPAAAQAEGASYRPRVAWRPGRAEVLVATGKHLLRVDAVALMCKPGDENAPDLVTPEALPAGSSLPASSAPACCAQVAAS
jgi:hypothetical protein